LFSKVLIVKCDELEKYFEVEVSKYWQTHFVFDKLSILKSKHQGVDNSKYYREYCRSFFIRVWENRSSEEHQQRALKFLEEIPSEKNIIIEKWNGINIKSNSAYASQGLLQLKMNIAT